MRLVLAAILIIIAIGIFFAYVSPTYGEVQALRVEERRFDEALDRSRELIAVRDQLLEKYNGFSTNNLDRLEKLLPNHIDSVRLIIDVDGIAAEHGLRVEDIGVDVSDTGVNEEETVGEATLSFSVQASYGTLKQFLADLESSLRLLDVTSISFKTAAGGLSQYNITLKTYWLR